MALHSQTARPVSRRSYMYRRPRRRRNRTVIAIVIVLLAVLTGITLWSSNGAAGPAERSPITPDRPGNIDPILGAAATGDAEPVDSILHVTAAGPQSFGAGEASQPPADYATDPDPAPPADYAADLIAADDELRPQPTVPAMAPSIRDRQRALLLMESGLTLADANRPLQARQRLTSALELQALAPGEAQVVRDALINLNRRLVFSPEIVDGDPFCRRYVVGPNDQLGIIVKEQSLAVDWRFIMRINRIPSERHLRAGHRLKLVTGPFHAVVHKSDFRLDLYMGSGAGRVFVASYSVGLGEFNSTPLGMFRVRAGTKLINPAWTNPRTGQRFESYDPQNPIGERWIGLAGIDEATRDLIGYGIHGTIEPESVGRQSSMGCIRMLPEDVEIIYEVLIEQTSTVEIRP
ncbi:MAG: L,D-transpeptidase [Planctomycetes bacterium]|nr:L,D-transpeptidase [Planctomycetota bacterium]